MDIATTRLVNQHLIGDKFDKPEDVVEWLGAVQAQDYPAAKWALGLRLQNATDASIERAFNEGKILRTHVMRPTWHFVLPENLLWMQKLTRHRVKKLMSSYNRKLELDDALFAKTNRLLPTVLQNHNYLTRQEIKKLLEGIGITTDVQRLAHIMMWPELDGLICSGPRRGKQFTYALVAERIKKSRNLNKEESLAELSLTFFQSHGPAQLKDFAWWSGLSITEAKEGLDLIKNKLVQETVHGAPYWFSSETKIIQPQSPTVFLLSIYDEYTIAYKDRSDMSEQRDIERMIRMGNALTAVIILDGKAIGTWKRAIIKNKVEIKASLFRKFTKAEKEALELAADEYERFLGLKATLEIA